MKSPQWTWYLDYLGRVEKEERILRELRELEAAVKKLVEGLIHKNKNRIRKLNPKGHNINFQVVVTATQSAQY